MIHLCIDTTTTEYGLHIEQIYHPDITIGKWYNEYRVPIFEDCLYILNDKNEPYHYPKKLFKPISESRMNKLSDLGI